MSGYRCPSCNCLHTKVTATYNHVHPRTSEATARWKGKYVRQRQCERCGHNFRTREEIEDDNLPKEIAAVPEPQLPPPIPENPYLDS